MVFRPYVAATTATLPHPLICHLPLPAPSPGFSLATSFPFRVKPVRRAGTFLPLVFDPVTLDEENYPVISAYT